jgi:hypothetical protein
MAKDILAPEIIEEIMQETIGPKWREMAEIHLNHIINSRHYGANYYENSGTFSMQIFYIQRRIRSHLSELKKISSKILPDTEYANLLRKIGLYPSLISQQDFFLCLDELKIEAEEKIESDFGCFLLSIAYPQIFPPFNKEARPVEEQAAEQNLQLVEVSKKRESYCGSIVGIDNHKILINYARFKAFILYFLDLPSSPTLPTMGDIVFIKFNDEKITELKFVKKNLKSF